MNDRDFHNYQRILSGYPPEGFALLAAPLRVAGPARNGVRP